MAKTLSVWATSLGCPKNGVDTERLLGSLGCEIRLTDQIGRARLALINTCAFIEPACRESLRAIFDAGAHIRRLRRKPLLVVAGCLPGRYGIRTLAEEIPEVDLWLDSKTIDSWPRTLSEALGGDSEAPSSGRLLLPRPYAWLKIGEGCQRKCAFCAIPKIRGPLRSESADFILDEARRLVAGGAKELILVGQDVTAWGRDLIMNGAGRGPGDLPGLLRLLRELDGLFWLRLMYLYPDAISDGLIEIMAEGAPILPYFDLPLQHCRKNILAAMGRPPVEPLAIIEKIRARLPDAALRATLMVGYPGETEADFRALLRFVKDVRFHNLGVFPFMPEEGVKAASLPGQLPDEVKNERADEIMTVQAEISAELLGEFVGAQMDVIVDRACPEEWPGLYAGRVWFQAPEVDGTTYISGENVRAGAILKAEIADSQAYDLSALA